jgi:predicted RNase H-like HicB family nuclease
MSGVNAGADSRGKIASMPDELTAIIEQVGEWFIASCPEVPEANGQGRTREAARASLGEAIRLILEDRREDGLRGVSADFPEETVVVKEKLERDEAFEKAARHVLEKNAELYQRLSGK